MSLKNPTAPTPIIGGGAGEVGAPPTRNRILPGVVEGGQFTFRSLREPAALELRRSQPVFRDIGELHDYTPRTSVSGEQVNVVDETDDENVLVVAHPRPGGYIEVTSINPFGGEPVTGQFSPDDTHLSDLVNDAEYSVRFGQDLVENDPDLARHIERLSYIDEENTVAVVLKAHGTQPAKVLFVNTMTGHFGDRPGSAVGDPGRAASALLDGTAHSAHPRLVADMLRHIVKVDRAGGMSDYDRDRLIARTFAARLIAPIGRLKNDEAGYRHRAQFINDERNAPYVHIGDRLGSVDENDQRTERAVDELLTLASAEAADTSTGGQGRTDGYATIVAALRLADENPNAAMFQAAKNTAHAQLLDGQSGQALLGPAAGAINAEALTRAASLLAKAVHHDTHARPADPISHQSALVVITALTSLQKDGKFTGSTNDREAITQLVSGARLDGYELLNGPLKDADRGVAMGWFSPRLPPLHGVWQ